MKYVLITIIWFVSMNQGLSQDSLKLESELSIDIKGQHLLSALSKKPIECINCFLSFARDNPFHHFAIYSGFNYKGTLAGKYFFETGLYLEERSFSGGNNTLTNLVFFPNIKVGAISSFTIKQHLIKYKVLAGDFWDEDISDILRFYNIDSHGLKTKFGWNNFWLGIYIIGDLSRNIGFDLHEMYKITIEYRSEKFTNVTSLSINELHAPPIGNHPDARDYNFANFSKFNIFDDIEVESQIDIRSNRTDNIAIAMGVKMKYNKENISVTSGLRYYQAAFNRGYRSFTPRYRLGSSYIGTQLYPLKNYYRPINQWALFTNYQNRDLLNWELYLKWNKKLFKKFHFTSEIDLNLVYDITAASLYYYPFYNVGISVNFLDNFVLSITGTNKHMNLDTYYQTSSASKLPLLSYSVKMNLDKIRMKTVYLK